MRKIISKIAGLMLGLSLAAGVGVAVGSRKVGEVKAAPSTETFSHSGIVGMATAAAASTSGTYSVFTITVDGIASSGYNASESVRVYKGASITISVSSGNITSATLTCTANGTTKYGPGCLTGDGWSAGTAKNGTWSGSAASFTLTASSNQARISDFSITYETGGGGESDTFTVSFNSNGGTSVEAITGITSGSTISQPANPTKANCTFVGWYTDSALSSAYNFSSQVTSSFTLYAKWELDLDHSGSSSDPYTVSDARSAIDANLGLTDVYTSGIVYQVDSFNETYHSITYWISDDGTGSSSSNDGLEVYSGKGISGANFSSVDDIKVGDEVVVKGTLKKYNSTYEYDKNNELLSLTRKIAVNSLALSGTDISSNTMSISSSDISAHTVTVTINSDATDKVVNIAHQSGSSIFTLSSASITCNSSGVGSFTITGTEETSGSETFRVSSNSNPTVYQDLVVTALDDSVVYHVVSFNSNGGSTSPANQNVEHGTSFTFPSPGTKEHYSFEGWSSDGGTTKYAVSATSPAVNDDVSYTAYWAEDAKYTVTYTAGTNGSGSFADANIYAGSYTLKAFDTLTGVSAAEGYRFKNYTVSGTDYNAGVSIAISGATAVTVNFEPIPLSVEFVFSTIASAEGWVNSEAYTSYTISPITIEAQGGGNNGKWYSSGGGSWRMYSGGTLEITAASGYAVTSVTSTPSCEFTISNGVATFSPSARTDFTSIVVSYEQTASVIYTITYDANGGSGSMTPTSGASPLVESCSFTAPTGKEFSKWNDLSDGTGNDYSVGDPVSADVTLYAIWATPAVDPSEYFTKITSTSEITDGKYLIVYEDGNLCFDGSLESLDAASNTKEMTLSNLLSCYFTISSGEIKAASGKYIGNASDSNGLTSSSTALENTVSIDESGNLVVVSSGGAYLRYNKTSGQERFRYFKSSTYTAQQTISLYKVNIAKVILGEITCDDTGSSMPGGSWSNLESYYNTLSTSEKNNLKTAEASESGSELAKALAKYDYIVGKYLKGQGLSSYKDFMQRDPVTIAGSRYAYQTNGTSQSSTIVIVVVALTSITSIGVLLVIKRKRSLVK